MLWVRFLSDKRDRGVVLGRDLNVALSPKIGFAEFSSSASAMICSFHLLSRRCFEHIE